MSKKNLSEYSQKYKAFRHHAWAGGILLSVLLAFRYLIPNIPNEIFISIGLFLIIYILVTLFFTYRYRAGLSIEESVHVGHLDEYKKQKIQADVEKERLKLEKKKIKLEKKKTKKMYKKK